MTDSKKEFQKTKSTTFDSKYNTTLSWISNTKDDNPESLFNENPQYRKIYFQFLKNNTRTKGIVLLNNEKQSK